MEMINRTQWESIRQHVQLDKLRWPTFLIVMLDFFMLGLAVVLHQSDQIGLVLLSYFFLSLSLFHFYLHLHEATHSAVSKIDFVNNMFGHFCGWMIFMPFLPRQTSHLLHHTWTGHPSRDPANNRMIQRFSVITPEQVRKLEFVWKYWFPMIIINDRIGLWRAPLQQYANGLRSKRVQTEIRWNYTYAALYIIAFALIAYTGHLKDLFTWYLPSIFMVYLVEELANLPHHAETPLLNVTDKALPYWEQHKVTHSCRNVFFWSPFILLNFNMHTAHHMYPTAPWFTLPDLNKRILGVAPNIVTEHETQNEIEWSLKNRRRPLLSIMGHYFDKIPNRTDIKLG